MALLLTCLVDQGLALDIRNLRKLALQIYHVFALLVQKSLLLGLALDNTSIDLLLNDLASGIEHLIKVLLLLLYLISEGLILLLDALDEYQGEFVHVLQFTFDAL